MKSLLAGLLLLGFVSSANAFINIGYLSYDNSNPNNQIIKDSLNNLEWLRWNVLQDLNYEQTLAATQVDSAYEGWSVAYNYEANLFTNALLNNDSLCNSLYSNYEQCNRENDTSDFQGLTGSYIEQCWACSAVYFLTDIVGVDEMTVGNIFIGDKLDTLRYREVTKYTNLRTLEQVETSTYNNNDVSWLLYRNATTVAETSSIILLCVGLFGLFSTAGRKP